MTRRVIGGPRVRVVPRVECGPQIVQLDVKRLFGDHVVIRAVQIRDRHTERASGDGHQSGAGWGRSLARPS
jgi:hypothetical protein